MDIAVLRIRHIIGMSVVPIRHHIGDIIGTTVMLHVVSTDSYSCGLRTIRNIEIRAVARQI